MTTIILSEWNKYEFIKPNDEIKFQLIKKVNPIKLSQLNQNKYSKEYTFSDELNKQLISEMNYNINKYRIIDIISCSEYNQYLILERVIDKQKYDIGITVNMVCNNEKYLKKISNMFQSLI